MIEVKNAYKKFSDQVIFEDISLEISEPGFYVLWGKSGCGKTTLLNIFSGIDTFDTGDFTNEYCIVPIFQNYELIEELNVYDNLYLSREETEGSRFWIQRAGIEKYLNQYPHELSGGQKQRVAVVRALIAEADVICCDEPTASLDRENRKIILQILKDYAKNHIVICATHQYEMVENYAEYLIQIENKKIYQYTRRGVYGKNIWFLLQREKICILHC